MLRFTGLLVVLMALSSCATLFKKKSYTATFTSSTENARAEIYDTVYTLPATVTLLRSKEKLPVKVITDTLEKTYRLVPFPHRYFWNNILWAHLAPVAYAVDFTNPKRFYYGDTINFNLLDTSQIIRTRVDRSLRRFFKADYTPKSKWRFTVGLPYVNSFHLKLNSSKDYNSIGFLGISGGLDYFYRDRDFVSIEAGAVIDFFIPFPALVDYESGYYESATSWYLSLINNYTHGRFSVGYGFSYAVNKYTENYLPIDSTEMGYLNTFRNYSLGCHTNAYYQLSKNLHLGVLFRPTFILVPNLKWNYQHLISIDLKWRISL